MSSSSSASATATSSSSSSATATAPPSNSTDTIIHIKYNGNTYTLAIDNNQPTTVGTLKQRLSDLLHLQLPTLRIVGLQPVRLPQQREQKQPSPRVTAVRDDMLLFQDVQFTNTKTPRLQVVGQPIVDDTASTATDSAAADAVSQPASHRPVLAVDDLRPDVVDCIEYNNRERNGLIAGCNSMRASLNNKRNLQMHGVNRLFWKTVFEAQTRVTADATQVLTQYINQVHLRDHQQAAILVLTLSAELVLQLYRVAHRPIRLLLPQAAVSLDELQLVRQLLDISQSEPNFVNAAAGDPDALQMDNGNHQLEHDTALQLLWSTALRSAAIHCIYLALNTVRHEQLCAHRSAVCILMQHELPALVALVLQHVYSTEAGWRSLNGPAACSHTHHVHHPTQSVPWTTLASHIAHHKAVSFLPHVQQLAAATSRSNLCDSAEALEIFCRSEWLQGVQHVDSRHVTLQHAVIILTQFDKSISHQLLTVDAGSDDEDEVQQQTTYRHGELAMTDARLELLDHILQRLSPSIWLSILPTAYPKRTNSLLLRRAIVKQQLRQLQCIATHQSLAQLGVNLVAANIITVQAWNCTYEQATSTLLQQMVEYYFDASCFESQCREMLRVWSFKHHVCQYLIHEAMRPCATDKERRLRADQVVNRVSAGIGLSGHGNILGDHNYVVEEGVSDTAGPLAKQIGELKRSMDTSKIYDFMHLLPDTDDQRELRGLLQNYSYISYEHDSIGADFEFH